MLAIRDLRKTYANGVRALKQVSPYNKLIDRVSEDNRKRVALQ